MKNVTDGDGIVTAETLARDGCYGNDGLFEKLAQVSELENNSVGNVKNENFHNNPSVS